MHLQGKVGTNINIVVDLVKSAENLSGYYYYYFDDHSGDLSWTHYGKSMPIQGKITADQFEFSEFDPEVKGAVFKGTIRMDTLVGTWNSSDGQKQLPLLLTEVYPEGTMAFNAYYLNESGRLLDKKAEPTARIEASLLTPGNYQPAAVADSVRVNIYDHFFDIRTTTGKPDSLLNALKELYFQNYRASNADLYQDGAMSFNWEKGKYVRIIHNEKNVLSIEYHDYGFTGGAHGLSLSNFHVISLSDGHMISLDEIFRDDYRNDLRDMINSSARKKYGLENNQGLTAAGFFVDFIDPTDNFYVTKDGMGFFYNQYEVAPYALGPVEIFVSYSNLMRILRDDSPVKNILSNGN
jgi:hypothetical protein